LSTRANFQVRNGLSINDVQVIDANTNASFKSISITGNITGNIVTSSVKIGSNQPLYFTDIYDLDDISYKSDGFTNTFPLKYNNATANIPSPFNLTVTINGILQPAFDYKYDTVWLANIISASKGYCIDLSGNVTSNGYIKFAECPPTGSQILMRATPGSIPATIKTYPFKPLDIVMGY
jgi:hypothetical protein